MTKNKKKLTPEEKDKRLGRISLVGGLLLSVATVVLIYFEGPRWIQLLMMGVDGTSIIFGICLAGGRTKNKKTIIISLTSGLVIAGSEMALVTGEFLQLLGVGAAVISACVLAYTMLFMME